MPAIHDKRPLSYSKFHTYTDCPLQYKLSYVDKIPEQPRPEYSVGRSIHKAIELFHTRGPTKTSMEDMLRILDRSWDTQGFPTAEDERRFKRAAKRILTDFFHDASKAYRPPLGVELKFDIVIEGIPFTGRIDLVEQLPDGTLEVLDYKSGEDEWDEKKVRANVQLGIYQMAVEAKYGKVVSRITIYHLRSRTRVTAPAYTDEMKAGLRRAIVAAASCIEAGMFEPRLSNSCPCDYPEHCPYFADKEEYQDLRQGKLMESYEGTGLSHKEIEAVVREYAEHIEGGKANSPSTRDLEARMLAYCTEHDVLRIFAGDLTVTLVHSLEPSGESYTTFVLNKVEKEGNGPPVKAREDDYV
jgi:RecB family exonuclease